MAAKDALAANVRLQVRIEETLKAVEHGLETNADMQARVQLSALRVNRSGWYKGLKGMASSLRVELKISGCFN